MSKDSMSIKLGRVLDLVEIRLKRSLQLQEKILQSALCSPTALLHVKSVGFLSMPSTKWGHSLQPCTGEWKLPHRNVIVNFGVTIQCSDQKVSLFRTPENWSGSSKVTNQRGCCGTQISIWKVLPIIIV